MKQCLSSFTLIEIVTTMAILSILVVATFVVVRPFEQVEQSQYSQAVTELGEIAKAVQYFAFDNGYYPADVIRDIPAGIEGYISPEDIWPNGPIPGSVYDYDNWSDRTCIDSEASGSVQITLRQVPGRNPDGSDVWAWYYVIYGKGTPHCSSSSEWDKGECVNCSDFVL